MKKNKSNSIPYWKLKKGNYRGKFLDENQIWNSFQEIYDSSKKTTSYKFALIYSIVKIIEKSPEKTYLSFDEIFDKFSSIYWKIVVKNKFFQISGKTMSSVYKILNKYILNNPGAKEMDFENLPEDDKGILLEKIKQTCSRNVFGALYGSSSETFYSFDIKEECIKLNPQFRELLTKYNTLSIR